MITSETSILLFFLLIPFFSVPAFGQVIINEIEISPIEGESQWIELHNLSNFSIPMERFRIQVLSNYTSTDVLPLPPLKGNFIEPNEYKVVDITFDSEKKIRYSPIGVLLLDSKGPLDSIEGINDNFKNDKTWQRFPDSLDSGNFQDWTFRSATKGMKNGNMGQIVAECSLDPFCWGKLDVFFHNIHSIPLDDEVFFVETFYDSKRLDVNFHFLRKMVEISTKSTDFPQLGSGAPFMHVTLPNSLMSGSYSVFVDGLPKEFYLVSGQLKTRLIIDQLTNVEKIEITATEVIPEFSVSVLVSLSILIFSLLFIYRYYFAKFFFRYKPL